MSRKNRNRQQQEQVKMGEDQSVDHVEVACAEVAEKVDFDAWFVMRGAQIPKQHHKEIIKADFKGRGLSQCESLEDFDAALAKYGVKLA